MQAELLVVLEKEQVTMTEGKTSVIQLTISCRKILQDKL